MKQAANSHRKNAPPTESVPPLGLISGPCLGVRNKSSGVQLSRAHRYLCGQCLKTDASNYLEVRCAAGNEPTRPSYSDALGLSRLPLVPPLACDVVMYRWIINI